jgi:hypothetical protein
MMAFFREDAWNGFIGLQGVSDGALTGSKEVTHGIVANIMWSGRSEDLLGSKSRWLKGYSLDSSRGALI